MIPEVSQSTSRCPYPQRWQCYDDMATEVEVLDLLTALVVALKPEVIVETGCYKGYGTERLLRGAIKNGLGHVYTCDIDHSMVIQTREWLKDIGGCEIRQCTGLELINSISTPIDFAFLDSGGEARIRAEELRAVLPKLSPWGVVAVHDTGQTHPDHREAIEGVVRELNLDVVFFDTPRGMSIIKKRV